MADDKKSSGPQPDAELSDAILDWIAGGATSVDAHGCPACPHPAFGSTLGSGSHILIDGTTFSGGQRTGKVGG